MQHKLINEKHLRRRKRHPTACAFLLLVANIPTDTKRIALNSEQ